MNQHLSAQQIELHQRAIHLSREHRKIEWSIIEVLREVGQTNLHKLFGHSSLFQYAVNSLGFTESLAYSFITVARKTVEVSELKTAIQTQRLSVAKASRMISVLTKDNAHDLIGFAQTHTTREIDFEVARLNPKAPSRERAKPVNEYRVELQFSITKETFEKLKRAENLAGQRGNKTLGLAGTLEILVDEYLKRQDPVARARRSLRRQNKKSLCLNRARPTTGRVPLKAHEKHQVFARDGGRCTFQDASGKRCPNERWLHLHHRQPVSCGGTNDPQNLTTLCSFHHDLTHQLSLPIDGQVTWVRARQTPYAAMKLRPA